MGIARGGLPEEGGEIIIIRAFATTLVIDEPRIAIMVKHHVPGLEVTVEETLHLGHGIIEIGRQILGKKTEVSLQLQLMEVEFGSFQETILEIVEVEENAIDIKLCLRIAVGEV